MKIGESKQTGGSKFPRIEDGTYPALLVGIVDVGVQPQTDWKTGKEKAPARKLFLTFELPTETIEIDGEEKPRWIGKDYTFSFHEKAGLTKVVDILKREVKGAKNMQDLLGVACMVTVGSTGTGNAKLAGVVPKVKGMPTAELQNEAVCFDMDEPDLDTFNKLPQWLQNKITSSLNFSGSKLSNLLSSSAQEEVIDNNYDDEIPFDDD